MKIIVFFCLFAINAPFSYGKESTTSILPLETGISTIDNDVNLKIKDNTYKLTKEEIKDWLIENNDLRFNPRYSSEIENINVCNYKKSIVCKLSVTTQDRFHIQKSSSFSLNTDLVKKYIQTLSKKTDKDPINATFDLQDGKISVFSMDEKGIELDQAESSELLIKYITEGKQTENLELSYKENSPDISINSINNLGITSLIGEGRSNFRGSPKNRIFNIKAATKRFHGVLIKPGEEFSFVKILGEVDGDHGYLPELVIKNDKTEPEFGGGICQVSTTAFRAAIYSGLKITARRNHAYPVSYYNPQGMDSTIYIPRPDLRFVNDTPGHILIQTEIVGTELIFKFFGTSDGRQVSIDGPHILEKKPDGSMKTTFSQKVTDKNNDLIREDVFKSSYDSPSKYPHPGDKLTQKPKNWSKGEWERYLKENTKP